MFNEFKGEAEIRALSLAGMDGEVLGNHEFDGSATSSSSTRQLGDWSRSCAGELRVRRSAAIRRMPSLRDVIQPLQIYDVQGSRSA